MSGPVKLSPIVTRESRSWPDMNITFMPASREVSRAASSQPFIPGITTSDSSKWIGPG